MQKTGGIIALIAGVLSLFVLIAEAFVALAIPAFTGIPAFSDSDIPVVIGCSIGWITMVSIVIVLSIIALKTTRRWPRIVLVIWSIYILLSFGLDFWIVSFYLCFAVIGGLMTLNLNRGWWALILGLGTVYFVITLPFNPPLPYTPFLPSMMSQFWQGFVDGALRQVPP